VPQSKASFDIGSLSIEWTGCIEQAGNDDTSAIEL